MPKEPQPPRPFICPYCFVDLHGLEFRPYGNPPVMAMMGCPACFKPLPVFPIPQVAEPDKKSQIIATK